MNVNQPRKRGKRYALTKARKLEKTAAERLEEKRRAFKNDDIKRCEPSPDPVDEATDDAFFKFCDPENYPIFCHLDRRHLREFISMWANRCDPTEEVFEDEFEWKT